MKKPIFIAGLQNSGKTAVICSLLKRAESKGKKGAAFKPFDFGLLERNAAEMPGDGELFCQNMQGEPMETLVSPYCANESYPIEMSFRRDGITINFGVISERLAILDDLYDFTLIEVPGSIFMPITEDKFVIDWLQEAGGQIVWIIHPILEQFYQNLAELQQIMSRGLDFSAVFNNASQVTNQDLLFYTWEKTEEFLDRQIEGMIPFLKDKEADQKYERLGEKIEMSVPKLFNEMVGVT